MGSPKYGNATFGQLFADDLIDRDPVTGQTDIGAAILDVGQLAIDTSVGLGFAAAEATGEAAAYAIGAGAAGDAVLGLGSSMADGGFSTSTAIGSAVSDTAAAAIAVAFLPVDLPVAAAAAVSTLGVLAAYGLGKAAQAGYDYLTNTVDGQQLWQGVENSYASAVNAISSAIDSAEETVENFANAAYSAYSNFESFSDAAQSAVQAIEDAAEGVIQAVGQDLSPIATTISNLAGDIGDAANSLLDTAETGAQAAGSALEGLVESLSDGASTVANDLSSGVTSLVNSTGEIIDAAASSTASAASDLQSAALAAAGAIADSLFGAAQAFPPDPGQPADDPLIAPVLGLLGEADGDISPLVLDLAGAGLNLSALTTTSPYFDLTSDGFANQTGWVGAGMGILCLPNANGNVTSINQLFGSNSAANGFAALAALDANHDGVINASDPEFSALRVWVDSNGNGKVDAGELYTLSQLGIVSINLSATVPTGGPETIAGNTVNLISTYTLSNGTIRTIADVWLTYSPTYTEPDVTVTPSAAVAALPQVSGFGTVADLHTAMMSDTTLQSEVQALVNSIGTASPGSLLSAVQTIMLEWSGSTAINPNSDASPAPLEGLQFDARELDFLNKYTGVTFYDSTYDTDAYGDPTDPRWVSAVNLRQAWNAATDAITARVLLQAGYTVPGITYDAATDAVLPATDLLEAMASQYSALGDLTAANAAAWELTLRVDDAARLDMNVPSDLFLQMIDGTTTHNVAAIASAIVAGVSFSINAAGAVALNDSAIDSVIYGAPEVRLIELTGTASSTPPSLDDTVIYDAGDGSLELSISDFSLTPDNLLQLRNGIVSSQITVSADGAGNLYLTDGTAGDQIKLDGMMSGNSAFGVQQVVSGDGTTLSSSQLIALETTGTPGKGTLYGTSGADVFDSRRYSTYELGNGGADTFVYIAGYGHVEVNESQGGFQASEAVIQFGTGITTTNITFVGDSAGDLLVSDGTTGDQIKIDNMLNQNDFQVDIYGVAEFTFANGTTWDRQQAINLATTGTPGPNTLYGSGDADVFDGKGGGDYEQGNGGADTFIYNAGYGALEINEVQPGAYEATNAILQLGTGITIANVSFTRDGAGDLLVNDGTNGDQVKIDDMLLQNAFHTSIYGVGAVVFANGTTLSGQLVANFATAATSGPANLSILPGNTIAVEGPATTINAGTTASVVVSGLAYVADSTSGITATSAAGGDLITAPTGNDTLVSGGNADTLIGGSGSDVFTVNGNDAVELGTGAATVSVASGSAVVGSAASGNSGNLLFFGGSLPSTVTGCAGAETIYAGAGGGFFAGGSSGNNALIGSTTTTQTGALTLIAAGSNNYLQGNATGGDVLQMGSAANATIVSEFAGDTVDGGAGAAMIVLRAASGADTVNLSTGAATVSVTGAASALVAANAGNLEFIGGTTASTVTGSAGSETVYAGSGGGAFTGGTNGGNVLIGSTGSTAGQFLTLTAAGSSNYLQGNNTGNDLLQAGNAANATIVSEAGNDTINGGSGAAIAVLYGTSGRDTVNLASGAATVSVAGAASAQALASTGAVEFIGGTSASTLTGGAGSETVFAGSGGGVFTGGTNGNNVLVGSTGSTPGQLLTLTAAGSSNYLQGNNSGLDLLQAGAAGNTTIVSEAGGDTIVGGSGSAIIVLQAASGRDTVAVGTGAGTVSAAGGASAIVNAGAGSLDFIGGTGASTVTGGSGNETIYAGTGGGYFIASTGTADVMVGGAGAATFYGGAGSFLQGDTAGGAAAADVLIAGAGNETLMAGSGADTLAGNSSGTDLFSFIHETPGQTYTITSFHSGDELYMASSTVAQYAQQNQTTSGSTTTITLQDNTKIVVQGASSALTSASFGHP